MTIEEKVLNRLAELKENAEYHYFGPDEAGWMKGYIEALEIVQQELKKVFDNHEKSGKVIV